MTPAPLTIIDSPVQLDGEIGHAWTWEAGEPGCPVLTPSEPAASTAHPREDTDHG